MYTFLPYGKAQGLIRIISDAPFEVNVAGAFRRCPTAVWCTIWMQSKVQGTKRVHLVSKLTVSVFWEWHESKHYNAVFKVELLLTLDKSVLVHMSQCENLDIAEEEVCERITVHCHRNNHLYHNFKLCKLYRLLPS